MLHMFFSILTQLPQGVELLLLRKPSRNTLRHGPGVTVVFLRTTEAKMDETLLADTVRQVVGAAHVRGCSAKAANSATHGSSKSFYGRAGGLQTFRADISRLVHPVHNAADMIRCLSLMALFAKHGALERPNCGYTTAG
jgi:hypothetical protein